MATPPSGLPNLINIPKGYGALNEYGLSLANLAAWHLHLIGKSGILATAPENFSIQPLGSQSNPVMASFKQWKTEPSGSIPFDEQNSLAFTGTASAAFVPVLRMVVPHGFDGVIKWISNNVAGGAFVQGSLVWQILVNGRPVRNFANITQEKGTIAQGREVSPIRLFSGDIVQYVVQEVIGGLTGSTVVSLSGYYYPSKGIS